MTKRYSIEQVADMLRSGSDRIRLALEELEKRNQLSAETFLFAHDIWRITPTDVPKIQEYLRAAAAEGVLPPAGLQERAETAGGRRIRRVTRRQPGED